VEVLVDDAPFVADDLRRDMYTELEAITLALMVVSVFIKLLWAVEGCAVATWLSPDGGVRHSSSDVSGDDWSDRDGVGRVEVGDDRIGLG
jgi:hypothetical protein